MDGEDQLAPCCYTPHCAGDLPATCQYYNWIANKELGNAQSVRRSVGSLLRAIKNVPGNMGAPPAMFSIIIIIMAKLFTSASRLPPSSGNMIGEGLALRSICRVKRSSPLSVSMRLILARG